MKRLSHRVATSLPLISFVALLSRVLMTYSYTLAAPHQALAVLPFHFEAGNIAHSIAIGNGFSSPFLVLTGPTAWTAPVYPYLLAGVLKIFGVYTFPSFLAAAGLNIVFSTLACVPIFYAGKRIAGVGAGALAAWLWAIFPNANLLTFQALWDASLDALLCATILWATLVLEEKPRSKRPGFWSWIAYGALWGLTAMTNPALLSLFPFLLGWIAYRYWRRGWVWLQPIVVTTMMLIACCVPWTIRNYRAFHAFVPLRSTMGLQLWLGNNADTTTSWLGLHHPIYDSNERDKYIQMGEVAYMQEKQALAIQYMQRYPARVMELTWRRFLTVWSGGAAFPIHSFVVNRDPWYRYVLLFNLVAAAGTLLGIVALWRSHSKYAFPVGIIPAVFPWPYYLTLVEPRYRLPIDPVVLLLLAVALRAFAGLRPFDSAG